MSAYEIINYLDFFINSRLSGPQYALAIEKWLRDRAFVSTYKSSNRRRVDVNYTFRDHPDIRNVDETEAVKKKQNDYQPKDKIYHEIFGQEIVVSVRKGKLKVVFGREVKELDLNFVKKRDCLELLNRLNRVKHSLNRIKEVMKTKCFGKWRQYG